MKCYKPFNVKFDVCNVFRQLCKFKRIDTAAVTVSEPRFKCGGNTTGAHYWKAQIIAINSSSLIGNMNKHLKVKCEPRIHHVPPQKKLFRCSGASVKHFN